jgi:thiol:disulfide interchange protein DsbD
MIPLLALILMLAASAAPGAEEGFLQPDQALRISAQVLDPRTVLADLPRSLGLGTEKDILEPDEAFRLSAEVVAPDRVQLTWDIASGTYLYQEKIRIALEGTPDVALGSYELFTTNASSWRCHCFANRRERPA